MTDLSGGLRSISAMAEGSGQDKAATWAADLINQEFKKSQPFDLSWSIGPKSSGRVTPDAAAGVLLQIGGALARQGLLSEAEPFLIASLALDPTQFAALVDLATLSFMSGKLAQARCHYIAALKLQPNAVEPLGQVDLLRRYGQLHRVRRRDVRKFHSGNVARAAARVTADVRRSAPGVCGSRTFLALPYNAGRLNLRGPPFDLLTGMVRQGTLR